MPVEPFDQLVGAAGDVKELEYISALHQTDCDELRRDCSIKADDIRLFLQSRYGIDVKTETVHSVILRGLGGGGLDQKNKHDNDDGDEDVIDLMEVVALLMIPTLLKARMQELQEPLPDGVIQTPQGLLEYVLKMILHDTTGSSSFKPLTVDLLKAILVSYGEDDLAENEELIERMMAATHGATMLDTLAFAEALTGDVRLYDISNEVRLTTLYEDVFISKEEMELSARIPNANAETLPTDGDQEAPFDGDTQHAKPLFTRKWMAPSIDVTADLYRSKLLVIFLWATIVISYFAYIWLGDQATNVGSDCECRVMLNYSYTGSYRENSAAIFCLLSLQVVGWLFLFALISISGLVLVTVGSIGNYVGSPWWQPLIGGISVLLFSIIPFATDLNNSARIMNNKTSDDDDMVFDVELYFDECTSTATTAKGLENQYMAIMALVLGVITASFHFVHVFTSFVPRGCFKNAPLLTTLLSAGTMFGEMHTKQAGSFKLAQMTKNALDIMRVNDESSSTLNTHFALGLGEFAKSGRKYRSVGGFFWTWKHLWNKKAYRRDGIWLSTRMISSNIAQWIITMYVLFRGVKLTMRVAADYEDEVTKRKVSDWIVRMVDSSTEASLASTMTSEETIAFVGEYLATNTNTTALNCPSGSATELFDSYCVEAGEQYSCNPPDWTPACALLTDTSDLSSLQAAALLDAAGVDTTVIANATSFSLQQATALAFDQIYPAEQYMMTVPVAIAASIAFLTAVYLSLAYIPSVCKTILMLRCGAIKTMRDPKFIQYRQAPDQVSILTGSLFWGAYFSSILVGATIGLLVFFFLWQGTSYYAQRVIALVVGFLLITVIRITLVSLCRCSMYKAFYRKRPALANFTLLALEWTNFALAAGFIIARMIKLLLASAASIGRIDIPFLAPGVGRLGPIELDNYPIVHTKDLLSHEAHRHPYIELLGVVYLMKLRFGDNFGNSAGRAWRLLFVYSLFPWLHQYRVKARPELMMTMRSGLSDLGRASTKRLDYLSLRHVIGSAIFNGDEDGNDGESLEPGPADGETPDESSSRRPSVAAAVTQTILPPVTLSSVNGPNTGLNGERVRQLAADIACLQQELDDAKGLPQKKELYPANAPTITGPCR